MSDTPPAAPDGLIASGALPDWDELLTLQEAATLSGLTDSHLRHMVADGRLQAVRKGGKLLLTTRRWLDAFLRQRQEAGAKRRGRPAKPLPADYQPPPRRGRPRKPQPGAERGDH